MGGSSSKPAPVVPQIARADLSQAQSATFAPGYLESLAKQNEDALKAASTAAAEAAKKATNWLWTLRIGGALGAIALIIGIVFAVIALYDLVARSAGWQTIMFPGVAHFTNLMEGLEVPSKDSAGWWSGTTMTTSSAPYSSTKATDSTVGIPGPTGPTGPAGMRGATGEAPPPPLLYQWWYGAGNMPGPVDAKSTTTVTAAAAPLSAGNQGSYGMQWWMYIKDWNYGYGKEKAVLIRPDATNSAVLNPKVMLHPTDNVLRVSVSIFPSEEGAAVDEPAPASAPEMADDVFTCDVPNIPLQSWFSVSLTVFERNLDVYINGMLVKSCFLSGVPKPAVGDIQITPNGGFSGTVCGLATVNRMLNPSDALAFYSASNACVTAAPATASSTVDTTGYAVKFGVYDAVGRQVREYTF